MGQLSFPQGFISDFPQFVLQEKLLDSITLPYAILFQEFHQVHMMDETWPNYDRIGVASALRRLWVVCSFLLVISFASNLKATSVVKTFEDPTDSVQKIRERYTSN